MIPSTDLMIGNIVQDIVYNKFRVVTGITHQKVKDGIFKLVTLDYEDSYLCENLIPIPLTEEILLKCGDDSVYTFKVYNDDGDCFYYAEKCQYLHELQNMYKAIEKQELEINL